MRYARAASSRYAGRAVAVGLVKRVLWFHAKAEGPVPVPLSVFNSGRMCRVLSVAGVIGDHVRVKITACARPGIGEIGITIRAGVVLIDQ